MCGCISVIVPVYNAEKYLRQCLDSIVNQSLENIEIICVNDGSTDDSLKILKEYAEKDKRIILLNQENSGAGHARNSGLSIAKGEYLSFLDSDDFFELNMLEEMYSKAKQFNADIVMASCFTYNEVTGKTERSFLNFDILKELTCFNSKEISDRIFQVANPGVWAKMYRREYIIGNKIEFQNLPSCNDVYFDFISLALAEKITYHTGRFVNYREGANTSITSRRGKHFNNIFLAGNAARDRMKKEDIFDLVSESFYKKMFSSFKYEFRHIEPKNHNIFIKKVKEFFPSRYYADFLEGIGLCDTKIYRLIGNYIKHILFFPWYTYKTYKLLLGEKQPFVFTKFVKAYLFFPIYNYKVYKNSKTRY